MTHLEENTRIVQARLLSIKALRVEFDAAFEMYQSASNELDAQVRSVAEFNAMRLEPYVHKAQAARVQMRAAANALAALLA